MARLESDIAKPSERGVMIEASSAALDHAPSRSPSASRASVLYCRMLPRIRVTKLGLSLRRSSRLRTSAASPDISACRNSYISSPDWSSGLAVGSLRRTAVSACAAASSPRM